jgi:hypothetical protein
MTQDEIIEMAIQGHASTRDAIRWAMDEQIRQKKPFAWYWTDRKEWTVFSSAGPHDSLESTPLYDFGPCKVRQAK